MTGILTIALPVQLIDLSTDSPHGLIIPVCDPWLPFSMLKKWIESRKMQAPLQA